MTPSHLVAVTTWVTWVAQGTGMPAGVDPDATIKTRAVMLGEQFSDTRMFTSASARFVAIECGLMSLPSVGILSKFLGKWWNSNKPALTALPGVDDEDMPAADRSMVRVWRDIRGGTKSLPRGVTLDTWLDMTRRPTPAAFAYIVKTDDEARKIAERREWMREPREPVPVVDHLGAIKRSLAAAPATSSLAEEATQARSVSSVPPEALEPPFDPPYREDTPDADHGRESARLRRGVQRAAVTPTPEHVRARRLGNPALRPIEERRMKEEVAAKLAAENPNMRAFVTDPDAFHAPWHDPDAFHAPWHEFPNPLIGRQQPGRRAHLITEGRQGHPDEGHDDPPC
jgi:hypothetical protein